MMKKPLTNRLNKRVSIQSKTITRGSRGSQVETWVDDFTTWGEVKTLTGREIEAAKQIHAESTVEVNIRYSTSREVTSQKRVMYGTRTLHILAVINVNEENKELKLLCKEVVE